MRRMHLFELEDFPWLPRSIRTGITDILRFLATVSPLQKAIVPRIADALRAVDQPTIVDLCSGSGGPLPVMHGAIEAELGCPVNIVLTDLYPPEDLATPIKSTGKGSISFHHESVDATDGALQIPGVRTLFTSFHHFQPDQARAILANSARCRFPIVIVEYTERALVPVILATLFTSFGVLFVTPTIRPFRWSRLFLTYIIPAIPLCMTWDGVVSALRTYNAVELEQLGKEAAPEYSWEAGRMAVKAGPRLIFLVGMPKPDIQPTR